MVLFFVSLPFCLCLVCVLYICFRFKCFDRPPKEDCQRPNKTRRFSPCKCIIEISAL